MWLLGIYQSYFDIWNALYYYYMVVAWGDVLDNGSGIETILAIRSDVMTRSNISLGIPSLVPLMTYTIG